MELFSASLFGYIFFWVNRHIFGGKIHTSSSSIKSINCICWRMYTTYMTHYFLFSRQSHKRPCHWLRALMATKAFFQMCWFWAPDIMGVFYLSLHEKHFLVIWSFIFLSSKENTYLSLKECVIWVCYQITTGEILNIYWMYAFRLNWLIYYREMVCILLLGVSTWCLKKLTETLTSIR